MYLLNRSFVFRVIYNTRFLFVGCCSGLLWFAAIAIVLLVILVLCLAYWPSIMYHFNLYHSKSLPYLSENFVGRERETEEIMQFMDFKNSTVRIINIIGSPGFGKSTLAMHVGHVVVKRGDVVHYVNMADFPEKDVKLILSEKVMDSARVIAKLISFDTLLRWARERYYNNLLILDNCDKVIHIQKQEFDDAVNKLVEESIRIKVIFTSRKHEPFPKYDRWVKIDELSEAHAYELLESKLLSRVSITQEEIQQIAHHTGNVPLALHIIGSLLCLPFSPTPSRVIQELQMNPMKILTPEDFPASEQMFTTIHLSYTYLSNETQKIGGELTVFPGSFRLHAAIAIVCDTDFALWFKCDEVLDRLVKSSLLEFDKRSERYQYHQLIREYFLYVKRNNTHDVDEQLVPHFYIYYADMLMFIATQFSRRYEKSLAVLDSERHNIQCLFEVQSLPIKVFVVTVMSLSKGINVGLLSLRFSREELCSSIKTYLKIYDSKIHRLEEILEIEGHHLIYSPRFRLPFDYGQAIHINKETILTHYMLLVDQVAKCEEDIHGAEAASSVFNDRRYTVEQRSTDIELLQFVNFFTILSQYCYLQKDYGIYMYKNVTSMCIIGCHRQIIRRMDATVTTCDRYSECDYYDIGVAYYTIGEYLKSAEFLEQAEDNLKFSFTTKARMNEIKIMIGLINTYDKLCELDKVNSTSLKLEALLPEIVHMNSEDVYSNSVVVQSAIDYCRRVGLDKLVVLLEDKLLDSVEEQRLECISKSQEIDLFKKRKSVPLDVAYNVILRLYEAKQYSRAVDRAMYYINILNKTSDFTKEVVIFRILVGKAMFHGGNYSIGMDQMELALNEIMKGQFIYEQEKVAACLYLIPRLKYIDQCYNVSSKLPMQIGPFILFLLFSPYPMPHFHLYENLKLTTKQSSALEIGHKSDTIELVDNTQGISVHSMINFEFVQDIVTSITDDYVTLLKNTVARLVNVLRNNPVVFFRLLFLPIWVFIVWVKLLCLYFWCGCYNFKEQWPPVLWYVFYYCVFILCFLCCVVRYTELSYTSTLRLYLRGARDPRFMCIYIPDLESHDGASETKSAISTKSIFYFMISVLLTILAILCYCYGYPYNIEAAWYKILHGMTL